MPIMEHSKYPCDICAKRFKEKRYVTDHKRYVHSKGSNIECDTCDVTFKVPRFILEPNGLEPNSLERNGQGIKFVWNVIDWNTMAWNQMAQMHHLKKYMELNSPVTEGPFIKWPWIYMALEQKGPKSVALEPNGTLGTQWPFPKILLERNGHLRMN